MSGSAHWGPEASRLLVEQPREAPPALFEKILLLAAEVDETVHDATVDACDEVVNQTLAHCPGIAAAWHVVSIHVEGGSIPPCSHYDRHGKLVCTLEPLPWPKPPDDEPA